MLALASYYSIERPTSYPKNFLHLITTSVTIGIGLWKLSISRGPSCVNIITVRKILEANPDLGGGGSHACSWKAAMEEKSDKKNEAAVHFDYFKRIRAFLLIAYPRVLNASPLPSSRCVVQY